MNCIEQRVIRYDGSFAGLLCAAEEATSFSQLLRDGLRFKSQNEGQDLFEETFFVQTDLEHARALWRDAVARGYSTSLQACFEAFCSDSPDRNNHTGRVLCAMLHEMEGIKVAKEHKSRGSLMILNDLNDIDILSVVTAAARCHNQAHKLKGLIRFSELRGGLWYAAISPDCDVLPLIAPHFATRYEPHAFMIHDTKRATAIIHEPGSAWRIVDGVSYTGRNSCPLPGAEYCTEHEFEVQEQWARYFSSVAIAERRNPRLQMSYMPKKYWASLPEMHYGKETGNSVSVPNKGAS